MIETERTPVINSEEYVFAIYPVGLMPGLVMTSEAIRKVKEAEEYRERRKNDKRKPPKPPSRPNARTGIGSIALGEV